MSDFRAQVPLQMTWRGPSGQRYSIAQGDATARQPVPAGTAFTIADADAAAFRQDFGTNVGTSEPRDAHAWSVANDWQHWDAGGYRTRSALIGGLQESVGGQWRDVIDGVAVEA